MTILNGNRLDGCIFGKPSPKDHKVQFALKSELPRKADLRPHCTMVEDQGQIGSCTANACVGALEYFCSKRDGQAPDLSRLFVYYNTRRLRGSIGEDTGASVAEAMASVLAFGACRSQMWPYDPNLFAQEPPPQAYSDGREHEAVQYARVPGAEGALHAVASGYPVVFGTLIPMRCYDEAERTGIIPPTTAQERSGQPQGGHCMLIVGYDLDKQMFLVRNSWGAGWGNGGYCEFPFDEMVRFSPPDSFWILLELEPSGNLSLVKPGRGTAKLAAPVPLARRPGPSLGMSTNSLRDQLGDTLRSEIDKATADIKGRIAGMRGSPDPSMKPKSRAATFTGACYGCGGTGTCFHCDGYGELYGVLCNNCMGNGICETCFGTGDS